MKYGMYRVWAVSLLLLASATLCAQKVEVQHNSAADFSKYKTYAWVGGTPSPNPVWDELIQATISGGLEGKGLKRVEAKDADLLVAYHVAGDESLNVAENFHPVVNYPAGMPAPVTSGPWYTGTWGGTARLIKKGTLAIHLFDRQRQGLVWAATAKDPVKQTPKKRIEQLNKAVDKMFAAYPPPPPAKP